MSDKGSRLASRNLHLLMETNLIGYNIRSSTPMHLTGQEGNNCITCGIWGGCVGLNASPASAPVTPVMSNIMGRNIDRSRI